MLQPTGYVAASYCCCYPMWKHKGLYIYKVIFLASDLMGWVLPSVCRLEG